jgi:hypothetical protein
MRTPSPFFAALGLVATLAACGPENGSGFFAQGSVRAVVNDPASTATSTGFTFQQQSRIDPNLPAGATAGFSGTCQIGTSTRTARITQVGNPDPRGLNEFSFTMPAWDQDTCNTCEHGTVNLTIGTSTFTGTEVRGGTAPSQCTFNAERRGSFGMQVGIACHGLTASGDARSVDLDTTLTLDGCDAPATNGM